MPRRVTFSFLNAFCAAGAYMSFRTCPVFALRSVAFSALYRFVVTALFLFAACITSSAQSVTTTNVGANQVTLQFTSATSSRADFTLLAGSGTTCGSAAQTAAGKDSSGATAYRSGSLLETANVTAEYTVRNLVQSTAFTVCFTPDGITAPVTANFTTTAAASYASPGWAPLGIAGLTPGESYYDNLAFGPDGAAYLTYTDLTSNYRLALLKYSGGAWASAIFLSTGQADYPSLAISPAGLPAVAYEDATAGYKASATMFNGTAWTGMGGGGFSPGIVISTSLAFAPDGTPYVAFQDFNSSNKVTVLKFDGTAWTPVGSAGFSTGQAQVVWMAVAPNGTPYVAYEDGGNSSKATVMMFDGTAWTPVGSAGFSSGSADNLSLVFAPNGSPYVAYRDGGNSNKATVMMFNGIAWTLVGSAGFSGAAAGSPSLAFGADGLPYLAYSDGSVSNKASVMKFNGSAWGLLGTAGFSAGSAGYPSLAFSSDGTPYLAFQDAGHGREATVLHLVNAPGATTGAANSVTAYAATLNGTVNDFGNATAVSFDYGTTASYGSNATATTPSGGTVSGGSGATAVAVSLSGLNANTTYHFRVRATGNGLTVFGADATFTTPKDVTTHFTVSVPSPAVIGATSTATVTAKSSTEITVLTYTGTVHLTSTDASATLGSNATLTNGTGTFSVVFQTPGMQTVTATDVATSSITGTSGSVSVVRPVLTISSTHSDPFYQRDVNRTYTITVRNTSDYATSSAVTVVDTLPSGVTATAISGSGWTCTLGTLRCTRPSIAANTSTPFTITVTIANTATSGTNSVTASGGGAIGVSATDPTTISPRQTAFVVDSASDQGGNCLIGHAPGACTLRAAMDLANSNAMPVATTTFDSTVFASPQTIYLGGSLPALSTNGQNATFLGPGRDLLTINGQDQANIFRSAAVLTLKNMTIQHGYANDTGGCVSGSDAVTLDTVTVQSCTLESDTGAGAGVYAAGLATLSHTTVSGNIMRVNYEGDGGGVYATGGLVMTDSSITDNYIESTSGNASGGGVYATTATITDTLIARNAITITTDPGDVSGAGLYMSDSGTLTHIVVTGNQTSSLGGAYGGGIFSGASSGMTITNSSITKNSAITTSDDQPASGGGLFLNTATLHDNAISKNSVVNYAGNAARGGGLYVSGNLSDAFTGNLIDGNAAFAGYGSNAFGGGIAFDTGFDSVDATAGFNTVSNNTAQGNGAGIWAAATDGASHNFQGFIIANNSSTDSGSAGGGMYVAGDTVTIAYSTFANNIADTEAGGLDVRSGALTTLSVNNTTITGNAVISSGTGGVTLSPASGTINFLQNTVIANISGNVSFALTPASAYDNIDDGCGANCPSASDGNISAPTHVAALAYNGGPAKTILPLAGSNVLGTGKLCTAIDERGYTRASGCDSGAVNTAGAGPAPLTITVPNVNIASGAAATITATVAYAGTKPSTGFFFRVDTLVAPTTCTGSSSPLTCTATFDTSYLADGTYPITALQTGSITVSGGEGIGQLTIGTPASTSAITVSAITIAYGTTNTALSASVAYTGSTPPSGVFQFQVDTGAMIAGNCDNTPSPMSCTATYDSSSFSVGAHTINATQDADSAYTAASATGALSITQASQTITFTGPTSPVTYGVAPITLSATGGGSSSPVIFSVLSGPGTLSGSALTVTGVGSIVLAANQAGDSNYTAAAEVQQTLVVNKASASILLGSLTATYDGNPHAATATTTPAGLSVAITYNGSSTAPTVAGSYPVVATITDSNYSGTASETLAITQATPVIVWAQPSDISYGTPLSATQLNAQAKAVDNSDLPGSYVYTPTAGTTLSVGSNQSLSVSFTPADTINYTNATGGTTITVSTHSQAITFPALPANAVYTSGLSYTLSASSSSGNAVTYTVTGPGTVSGSTLTLNAPGTVTVTASQGGDANYSAAPPLSQTITSAYPLSVGSQTSGSTSAAQTFTFVSPSAFTLGNITIASDDGSTSFGTASGGTCSSGQTMTAGSTCTVNFTFTALHPGVSTGKANIYDNAGTPNLISSEPLIAVRYR